MLKNALRKMFRSSRPETYTQLSKCIAQQLERRAKTFSIEYAAKNATILKQDLDNAIEFLDISSPYSYRLLKNYRASYTQHDHYYKIQLHITYETTDEEEAYVEAQLQAIAQSLLAKNQRDVDLVKAVHDYVIRNFSYNLQTTRSPYVVHTLFIEQQGVCQAMALFALKLLQKLGIPCFYVTGYGQNERHGWNLVQVDGAWYHLDITWDNPNFNEHLFENYRINYNYFLLSDVQIQKDHTFDTMYYPPAMREDYSMFHQIQDSVQIEQTLYFPNAAHNYLLYKMDLQTFTVTPALNVRVQFLSHSGTTLYFSNYSDSGHLYSYNTTNGSLRKLYYYEVTNTLVKNSRLYIENTAKDIIEIPINGGL